MNIVLIGTGNVGTVFGRLIKASSHSLTQIVGRSEAPARQLAAELKCPYVLHLDQLDTTADIYLLAIQDKEIPSILPRLHIPEGAALVHTAGGVNMAALASSSKHYGVIYPLQSVRKEAKEALKIPLFLDANDDKTRERVLQFASELSPTIGWADDKKRMKLHVAAVFASNFTNYMYALAARFCRQEQIDFQYLMPLIQETTHRLTIGDPAKMQTGPAARGDTGTIEKHLKLLESYPEAAKIYRLLSGAITQSETLSTDSAS